MSNKKVVKLADRQDPKTIKLKNSYFEGITVTSPNGQRDFVQSFKMLLDQNIFPNEYKPRYWLKRILEKIIAEAQNYQKVKQDLIQQHTKKYESDGKETDKENKVIKEWKKGDFISFPTGIPDFIDSAKFTAEFQELLDIEIDLGFEPIAFDLEKGPDAVGQEYFLLLPLLKEPEK